MTAKSLFLSFFLFLSFSGILHAQKVFSAENAWEADVKVYVTEHEYEADLLVHKVDHAYEAKGNKGLWYFTTRKWEADKVIFFVEKAWEADLKICFVKEAYQAGWKKREKMYLMY